MLVKDEHVFIVIPARRNSKRLKYKNVKDFDGFPLFEWSLAAALFMEKSLYTFGLKNITVICSSNDKKIIRIVEEKYASRVHPVFRGDRLSGDTTTLESVITHAVEEIASKHKKVRLKRSRYILLQPTSPIRVGADLSEFCQRFINTKREFSLITANENYKEFKDIYSLNKYSSSEEKAWIVGDKLYERGGASEKTAFIDGSIYSGEISSLEKDTFIPQYRTLVFFQCTPWSVDIDTEKDFDEAVNTLSKFKNKGLKVVEPEI